MEQLCDSNIAETTKVQTCLDFAFGSGKSEAVSTAPTLQSVQSDVHEIKSMLASMSVSCSETFKVDNQQQDNFRIKDANNLLELSKVPVIRIEISDDVCLVQCLLCDNFQQSSMVKK